MSLYKRLRAALHPCRATYVHCRTRTANIVSNAWKRLVDAGWTNPRTAYRLRLTRRVTVHDAQGRTVAFRMIDDGAVAAWMRGHDGEYEPTETAFFVSQLHPSMTILDIGANAGYFSLLAHALQPTATVYAFEPGSVAYSLLTANLRVNHVSSVHPYKMALSETNEPATLQINAPGREGLNTIGQAVHPGSLIIGQEQVHSSRLDDFLAAHSILHVDFIKMDVEGAELLVFRGALTLLQGKDAPVLLFEVYPLGANAFGYQVEEVIEYLSSCGYTVCLLKDDGNIMPLDTWDGGQVSAVARKIPSNYANDTSQMDHFEAS